MDHVSATRTELLTRRSQIQLAASGAPQIFEWLARRPNGTSFWVEVSLKRATIGGETRIEERVEEGRSMLAHYKRPHFYLILAASLAARGFPGARRILEGERGLFAAKGELIAALSDYHIAASELERLTGTNMRDLVTSEVEADE